MSRRSLLWSAAAVAGGFSGWRWLTAQDEEEGLVRPLRAGLDFNARLWQKLSSNERLSPEFPKSAAKEPRVNGKIGLKTPLVHSDVWTLSIVGKEFTVPDVQRFSARDVVTELRCIEGWSQIVHWTGAPLGDLLLAAGATSFTHVQASTEDGEYYVSLDRNAAMHPQSLVCWAMNGNLLTPDHGAPLRLVVPVKYGIKSLKRLKTISLTNEPPPDYWTERGYDEYVGL